MQLFERRGFFGGLERVKNVRVNYAIRSSGPVTPSPPAVTGMASEVPYLPARRSARYKYAFVPRRFFSTTLSFPFLPFNGPVAP